MMCGGVQAEMVRGLGVNCSFSRRKKMSAGRETERVIRGNLTISDRKTMRPPLSLRVNLNPTHLLIPLL